MKWQDVTFAGSVHDVGKLFIPDRILNKPGPLTEEEFAIIKTHPQLGAEVLRAISDSDRVAEAVRVPSRSFRWQRLSLWAAGENIPLSGRILRSRTPMST